MATNDRKITIAGQLFDLSDVYAEGHVVTAMEAKALNQTRAENIRNNFAGEVKKVQGERETLTAEEVAKLQTELNKYAKTYEFSVGGGRITDPVEREAKRIATEMVDAKIASTGVSKAKYIEAKGKDKYDALVAQVMDMDQVRNEAASVIKKRNKLADSIEF